MAEDLLMTLGMSRTQSALPEILQLFASTLT